MFCFYKIIVIQHCSQKRNHFPILFCLILCFCLNSRSIFTIVLGITFALWNVITAVFSFSSTNLLLPSKHKSLSFSRFFFDKRYLLLNSPFSNALSTNRFSKIPEVFHNLFYIHIFHNILSENHHMFLHFYIIINPLL